MSKAIMGAAMLGLDAAMYAGLVWGTGGMAIFIAPFFNAMAMGLLAGGIAMEAGAIAEALTSNRGQNITTRQAAGMRQIIYGMQRVGGTIIYQSTTGSQHWQMNLIIVLASHVIDSIENLYLDGRQVFWNVGSSGNVTRNGVNFGGDAASGTHIGPGGVHYDFGTLVYCEARFGDQADGDVMASVAGNDANWSTAAMGGPPWVGGCAYVYLKLVYHSVTLPQMPEIRFTVNGKNNIYDPRTGLSGFSQNWALIVADVLTDPIWGLGDTGSVNTAQLTAAANVCDELVMTSQGNEKRYALNIHYDSATAPGDALSMMMPAAAGRLSRIGGQWYIWPASWQGSSFNFDQSALIDTPTWTPMRSFKDLFNRVSGTFIAPNYPYNTAGNLYDSNGWYYGTTANNWPFAFQPTNYPQYAMDVAHGWAADQFLIEDGGIILPHELSQRGVLSVVQAQRVAKITLMRNRQQGSGSFPMQLAAWQMQPIDVMQFTFPALGWTNKTLEISGVHFLCEPVKTDSASSSGQQGDQAQMLYVQVAVQESDITVYEWSESEEMNIYDVLVLPPNAAYAPAAPTLLTLTSSAATAVIGADGIVTPRVLVGWNAPFDAYVTLIQIQYKLHSSPTWIDAGPVAVILFEAYVSGVVAGQSYDFQIRSLRASGATSGWITSLNYVVSIVLSTVVTSGQTVAPPGTLTAQGLADGTAQISILNFTATLGSVSANCYPAPNTLPGLAQSQLYYVYYVDPSFVGGAILCIATQNPTDYYNQPGHLFIGSIVTPSYAPRYQPSAFSDLGSSTTINPAAAFDNNISTASVISSSWWTVVTSLSGGGVSYTYPNVIGDCIWHGFPVVTPAAATTLTVIAGVTLSPGAAGAVTISVKIGSVVTVIATLSATTPEATYTHTIPAGTDLSTVSVEVVANVVGGSAPGAGNITGAGFEIYIG